ncbi:hypothetical protein [Microbacterium sp. P02]
MHTITGTADTRPVVAPIGYASVNGLVGGVTRSFGARAATPATA